MRFTNIDHPAEENRYNKWCEYSVYSLLYVLFYLDLLDEQNSLWDTGPDDWIDREQSWPVKTVWSKKK